MNRLLTCAAVVCSFLAATPASAMCVYADRFYPAGATMPNGEVCKNPMLARSLADFEDAVKAIMNGHSVFEVISAGDEGKGLTDHGGGRTILGPAARSGSGSVTVGNG